MFGRQVTYAWPPHLTGGAWLVFGMIAEVTADA
jgi:hypothetical protein